VRNLGSDPRQRGQQSKTGKAEIVEDTWGNRDVPVLNAVVALLEHSYMVTVSDIAERTGLGQADVTRSLDAMDPVYLDFRKTETGGDSTFWYVLKVTPEGRRVVGQWPSAEGLIDRLVKGFSDAADHEEDAEKHYQLRQAASLLSDPVRDVAVKVAATVVAPLADQAPAQAADPAPSAHPPLPADPARPGDNG
jgi:DNA-binding MarR family transcriptional regulator